MRPIDAGNLRGRVCEIFLCAEPGSAEERRFALILGLIDSEHTITTPPNDPLTLEELREMDGEPVWVVGANDEDLNGNGYAVVRVWSEKFAQVSWPGDAYEPEPLIENYGKTWLAYRRKPKER